jgi:hypothetical protein
MDLSSSSHPEENIDSESAWTHNSRFPIRMTVPDGSMTFWMVPAASCVGSRQCLSTKWGKGVMLCNITAKIVCQDVKGSSDSSY